MQDSRHTEGVHTYGVGAEHVGGFAVFLMTMASCAAALAVAPTCVVTIMHDMGWLMCWDVIDLDNLL